MGPGMGEGQGPWLGRMVGALSLRSAARPKKTIAWILVLTAVVGLGMVRLETDADLLKILPKDDPTTAAARNASEEFRGFYDFVTVFYRIDPVKCEAVSDARLPYRMSAADCGNVTDEAYVRGMEEVGAFFQARLPAIEYRIDLAGIIKTVNWTNSGYFSDDPRRGVLSPLLEGRPERIGAPRDEAFSMPGTDPVGAAQYQAAWEGANAADDSVKDVVAPTWKAGRSLFFFNASQEDVSRVERGRAFYGVVDEYAEAVRACDAVPDRAAGPDAACTLEWNVFGADEGLPVRGVSTLDAHASDTTKRDISILGPIIVWAIVAILYLAFRDARVLLVAIANLLMAFVWTAGLMGWLRIPFSALNMTIVPLILGVGIDYGIHMVSEFLEHKGDRDADTEAFRKAGGRAGLAMFIATVTTVGGLVLMAFSPSVLMAQLGIVSSIALGVTFLFTVTFIPALLVLTGRDRLGRRHRGSEAMLAVARVVGRHRGVVMVLVVVLTGAALWSMQRLEPEPFGNPELNYPPGDRVRDDAETISDLFFGGSTDTQSNYLIVEGDLTQPEAHRFLDALTRNLETHPDLQGFNTASLTRIVRAWVAIDQGTPDAIVNQFLLGNAPEETGLRDTQYPQTQEEIEATFEAVFASPFANFMTILLSPDGYAMGMVSYDTRQDLSFDEVQRVWTASHEAIHAAQQEVYGKDQEESGYAGPRAHVFGNNAFSYLFITKEQPWVNTIGVLSFVFVVGLIAVLTRNLRATLCTAAVMAVTGVWWLGLLPLLGVGLSVGLMLPIVFIMAIGSDDAIHLIWNMEQTRDRARVYRFVGKAVFLTSATTLVAFYIFSFQTDLLVTRTLRATAIAIAVMWSATMLIVPAFYPPPLAAESPSARVRRGRRLGAGRARSDRTAERLPSAPSRGPDARTPQARDAMLAPLPTPAAAHVGDRAARSTKSLYPEKPESR